MAKEEVWQEGYAPGRAGVPAQLSPHPALVDLFVRGARQMPQEDDVAKLLRAEADIGDAASISAEALERAVADAVCHRIGESLKAGKEEFAVAWAARCEAVHGPAPQPDLGATIHCAADFGARAGDVACCGQAGKVTEDDKICPRFLPRCQDYVEGQRWGVCALPP